jgi:hypothetical protein
MPHPTDRQQRILAGMLSGGAMVASGASGGR